MFNILDYLPILGNAGSDRTPSPWLTARMSAQLNLSQAGARDSDFSWVSAVNSKDAVTEPAPFPSWGLH